MLTTVEMQELHCHECGRYIQFPVDLSLNGNHVLTCPQCGHEHCRVVRGGRITSDRWDSRNPVVITVQAIGTTTTMTYTSWLNWSSTG